MNLRRRKMRLKARCILSMNHDQLVKRARELGLPGFCSRWKNEALIRNIKELENGKS